MFSLKRAGSTFFKVLIVFVILLLLRSLLVGEFYIKATKPLLISSVLVVFSEICFSNLKHYYISLSASLGYILSVLLIKNFSGEVITFSSYNDLVRFAIPSVNAILLFCVLVGKGEVQKIIKYFAMIVSFIPIILLWGYYLSSGAWASADTVMALLQTNLSESKEYMADSLQAIDWFILLLLVVATMGICWLASKLERDKLFRYSALVMIALIALNIGFAYRYKNNIITDIAMQTKIYMSRYEDFEKKKQQRKTNLNTMVQEIKNTNDGVYVLVIGESQNRNNMGAYGYERNTTPWLNSVKNNDAFLFFANTYSCHTHTVPVLTYALTAKNQYNDINLAESVSLLEMAEAAGYETVWVSNQVKYGAWDTPITVIADEANQQFWHNKNVGEKTATNFYDLKLIDSVDDMKLSNKMLIVFHLMGNHGSYRERYPKEFTEFKGHNSLDYYDNSILYNDYVMKNLFERVIQIPNFKGLIYFSDHADAVQQGLAHDASKFVPEMTHVPLYMYFSEDYIKESRHKFESMKKAQNTMLTNDLMFNTVLGVMDIQAEKIYEAQNDITSRDYDANRFRFKTLYGKRAICQ